MRRIQFHLDERMDNGLRAEARRRGISKVALIRLLLEDAVHRSTGIDPMDSVIDTGDAEPVDDINAIVHGR